MINRVNNATSSLQQLNLGRRINTDNISADRLSHGRRINTDVDNAEEARRSFVQKNLGQFRKDPDTRTFEYVYENYFSQEMKENVDALIHSSQDDIGRIHEAIATLYRTGKLEYSGQFVSSYREFLASGPSENMKDDYIRALKNVSQTPRNENQFTGFFNLISSLKDEHLTLSQFFHFTDYMHKYSGGILNTVAYTVGEVGTEHAQGIISLALRMGHGNSSIFDRDQFKYAMDRLRDMDNDYRSDFLYILDKLPRTKLVDEFIETFDRVKENASDKMQDFLNAMSGLNTSNPNVTFEALFTIAALAENHTDELNAYLTQLTNATTRLVDTFYEGQSETMSSGSQGSASKVVLAADYSTLSQLAGYALNDTVEISQTFDIITNPFIGSNGTRTANINVQMTYNAYMMEASIGSLTGFSDLLSGISQEAFESGLKEALSEYSGDIISNLTEEALAPFEELLDDFISATLNKLISPNSTFEIENSFENSSQPVKALTQLLRGLLLTGTDTSVNVNARLEDSEGNAVGDSINIANLSAMNLIFGGFSIDQGIRSLNFEVELGENTIESYRFVIDIEADASVVANFKNPISYIAGAVAYGNATIDNISVSFSEESAYNFLGTPLQLDEKAPLPYEANAAPIDSWILDKQQVFLANDGVLGEFSRRGISFIAENLEKLDLELLESLNEALPSSELKKAIEEELERRAATNTRWERGLDAYLRAENLMAEFSNRSMLNFLL